MAYEQRNNEGSIFVEENKQSDRHPDFKGSLMVDGKEYWVSGWKKLSKDGSKKFISLSVDPKQPKTYQAPPKREDHGASW